MDLDSSSLREVEALAESLRAPLLRVSRMLRRESQRAGLSVLEAHLLGAVKKNPGVGVNDLAEREQMTPASMSGHVKRLEQAGWIRRSDNAPGKDRRRICLTITAEGRKALDTIRRRRNDWLAARLACLTEHERAALALAADPLARLAEDSK
jgi:DNA-binding MarR family transcriptional regulator